MRRRGALIGAAAVLTLCVALYAGNHFSNRAARVLKMAMPGEYRVSISADDYNVWVFPDWPSKGVKGSADAGSSIAIRTPSGAAIQLQPVPPVSGDPVYRDLKHEGKPVYSFHSPADQQVVVSGTRPCVVALVPSKAVYVDLGSGFNVADLDDDSNFVQ